MKISVIIATKDRPEELKNTIDSLMIQSCLPDEFLLIDDGVLPQEFQEKIRQDVEKSKVLFLYYQKKEAGLCKSKNFGVSESTGDILFFLDDDVILEKDYIKNILEVFSNDKNKKVGGVQGVIFEDQYNPPRGFKNKLWALFEIILGQRSARFGKLLPSGFGKYHLQDIRENTRVDFICGCSSFRREVFNEFSFNEELTGYGYREDVDFSYRVSHRYDLIFTPHARLEHFLSTTSRSSKEIIGRQKVKHYYYFFKSHVAKKSIISYVSFLWSMLGLFLIRALSFLVNPKRSKFEEIKGICNGYVDIFKNIN